MAEHLVYTEEEQVRSLPGPLAKVNGLDEIYFSLGHLKICRRRKNEIY